MAAHPPELTPSQQLGSLIAAWREAAGLKQSEVAEKLNVTPGTISLHESGSRLPEVFRLEDYFRLYGVRVEDQTHAIGLLAAVQRARATARALTGGYHAHEVDEAA